MKVQFRVDASSQIGFGHVMRCLSLARALRDRGAKVSFVCRLLPLHVYEEIKNQGYVVHLSTEQKPAQENHWDWVQNTWFQDALDTIYWANRDKADWVVVDHYALASSWEKQIRSLGLRVLVVDDLANRVHDCDLLLDQNYYHEPLQRYSGLLPPACECMFGPQYALLRHQFMQARKNTKSRNGSIHRILLSFGGVDATNETSKALYGISQFTTEKNIAIEAVLGQLNTHIAEVLQIAQKIPGVRVLTDTYNMADLMTKADISFGAGGMTTWERCCLGLPSFITITATNQKSSVLELQSNGIVRCLGVGEELSQSDYKRAIESTCPKDLEEMSIKGMSLVDGQGSRRIAERILTIGEISQH